MPQANQPQCPKCHSKITVKKGIRKNKLQALQQYQCKECNYIFTKNPSKNTTYPITTILKAISSYNLGRTLQQTKENLHIEAALPTISSWLNKYKDICTFERLRNEAVKLYQPKDIIFKKSLNHIQPYTFKYNKAKLDILLKENPQFTKLKDYIEKISAKEFPHHIFTYPNQNNKQRHNAIQDFMLINDSTTIAVEVPVYLTNWDAGYYRNQKGFIFPLNNYTTPITGHIDILQVRNGLLHILDYKPDANKINPIEQLTIYALALSRKLNLPLYYFKCAWFDENNYFEFFPLHAVYEKKKPKIS